MNVSVKPELRDLPVDKLQRGYYQPRRHFREEELIELAKSIESAGLIQPIVVRPIDSERYEIVAGERRWRAAQLAGLGTVPCLINQYDDEQTAAVSTIENINRVDLDPIEEAEAYQRLIDEFGYFHDEVAAIVGKSRAKISNALRLLKLEKRVQQLLADGQLSEGHGKILASLPDAQQYALACRTVEQSWSVRRVEKEVKRLQSKGNDNHKKDANVIKLESNLGDYLGCKVNIDYSEKQCRMEIDCHDLEILQGVLDKIGFKE